MNQDQRVGLALGVLLVGACAAFFFRNETHSTAHTPQLQHAQELDDRIAERSIRPNLKGIQAVETADKRYANSSADPAHALDNADDAFAGRRDPSEGQFSGTRNPRFIRPGHRPGEIVNEIPEMTPIVVPGDSENSAIASSTADNGSTSGRGYAKPGEETRTYVVQKGDTLSSIAAKTLGSSHRFQELFDANHDQLQDPNDVKVGMALRIPDGRTETAVRPHPGKSHGAVIHEPEPFYTPADTMRDAAPPAFDSGLMAPGRGEQQDSPSILMPPETPNPKYEPPVDSDTSDEATSTRKFQPARRIPLPGRPAGPQARKDQSGRKLSQASLESTSGKVAR